jgi:hypothetical protein
MSDVHENGEVWVKLKSTDLDLSSEATLALVLAKLSEINVSTDGLELSLDNIDLSTDGLESALATLNSVDFSTQTTLEAARVLLASIDADTTSQEILTAIGDGEFIRLKNKKFLDTEEVRYDIPAILTNGDIYVGINTDGASTTSATWTVGRTYFDANGNPSRDRFRLNVEWDSRTVGW